jgi:hypothetical protein
MLLNKDLFVSFCYDSKAKPPLRIQVTNGIERTPLLDEALPGDNPTQYTAPHLNSPGGVHAPIGEALAEAARKLQQALRDKGVKNFSLQPALEVSGVRVNLEDGHEQSETPASWEVVLFIAREVALAAQKASKSGESTGE